MSRLTAIRCSTSVRLSLVSTLSKSGGGTTGMGFSFGIAFGLGVVLAIGLAAALALPWGVPGAVVVPFDFADFEDFFVFPSSS